MEGKYLIQETAHDSTKENDDLKENNEIECVSFSCDMPITSGRGFMEVKTLFISALIINKLSHVFIHQTQILLDDCSRLKTKDSAAASSLS